MVLITSTSVIGCVLVCVRVCVCMCTCVLIHLCGNNFVHLHEYLDLAQLHLCFCVIVHVSVYSCHHAFSNMCVSVLDT